MLYWEWIDVYGKNNRLKVPVVVPNNLKCEILHFYHDVSYASAGHLDLVLGNVKTLVILDRDERLKYCESCNNCAARKPEEYSTRLH